MKQPDLTDNTSYSKKDLCIIDGNTELFTHGTPTEETIKAIKDAKAGKSEGPVDTSSVEAMLKSIFK